MILAYKNVVAQKTTMRTLYGIFKFNTTRSETMKYLIVYWDHAFENDLATNKYAQKLRPGQDTFEFDHHYSKFTKDGLA